MACGSGDAFIAGRARDPCQQNLTPCPPDGLASCRLSSDKFAEVRFPGGFNFLAEADAGEEIKITIFFAEQRASGEVFQIVWNEPGCSDAQFYNSGGADLFAEAAGLGTIERSMEVVESGEHLIEMETDMEALTLVTVDTVIPGF